MSQCPRCGLEYDYIPPGGQATKVKNIRSVPKGVFARCCMWVGSDPQSGPLYCGDKATIMADSLDNPGSLVFCCSLHKHKDSLQRLEVE